MSLKEKILLKILGTVMITILVLFSHSLIVGVIAIFSLLIGWGDIMLLIVDKYKRKNMIS